jgi:hypothetical protein
VRWGRTTIVGIVVGGGGAVASALVIACAETSAGPPPVPLDSGALVPDAPASADGETATLSSAQAAGDADADAEAGPSSVMCRTRDDCRGGRCSDGVCVCDEGTFVQPDGACGPTPPPGGCEDAGGVCRVGIAKCSANELPAPSSPDPEWCGGYVPRTCCFPEASCRGPEDLVCCGLDLNGSAEITAPICVNGWKTCLPRTTPKRLGSSDGGVCGT